MEQQLTAERLRRAAGETAPERSENNKGHQRYALGKCLIGVSWCISYLYKQDTCIPHIVPAESGFNSQVCCDLTQINDPKHLKLSN